MVTRLGSGLTG